MVPVDFVDRGREVRHGIAVVGHAPRGRKLTVQPRREDEVADAGGAKRSQLDARSRSIGLVDERQVSRGVSGKRTAERMASHAQRAVRALLQCLRDSGTRLCLNLLVSVVEAAVHVSVRHWRVRSPPKVEIVNPVENAFRSSVSNRESYESRRDASEKRGFVQEKGRTSLKRGKGKAKRFRTHPLKTTLTGATRKVQRAGARWASNRKSEKS